MHQPLPGDQVFAAMQHDCVEGLQERWRSDPSAAIQSLGLDPSQDLLDCIPSLYDAAQRLHNVYEFLGLGYVPLAYIARNTI